MPSETQTNNGNELWIVIPKWEEFQHPDTLRSRSTPWIKDYVEQLHNDRYLGLSLHQRGVLHGLRAAYAQARGQLRANREQVSSQLGATVYQRDLDALNEAGLIRLVASRPQARRKPRSRSRSRHPLPPYELASKTTGTNGDGHPFRCAECGIEKRTTNLMLEHLRNVHGIEAQEVFA